MKSKNVTPWKFIDSRGTFELVAPHHTSYLYFPLVNEAGMMSVVTPLLHGDVKTGQHTFLTPPVSVEDLHNTRSARNFWLSIAGAGVWSVTGSSALQTAQNFTDQEGDRVTLQAGLLWHQITRENENLGLRAEMTSVVPYSEDQVELLRVSIRNISDHPIQFTPTAAIPIYARSADNLRDHRHVTSLLHRITCERYGVLVRPTLSFDERGHQPNEIEYAVLGLQSDGVPPIGFFPLLKDFVGEGGSLDWPEAVVRPSGNGVQAGSSDAGFEAMGGLRFADVNLLPGQSQDYLLLLAVLKDGQDANRLIHTYGTPEKFEHWLEATRDEWQQKADKLVFQTGDPQFDQWLRWVVIQPTLRRLFGNSFLPYHDYGRGGRGWRDLWQDILALLIMETGPVDQLLVDNFAGVRMDGSNATIIGSGPGEFKADRNNIPRVWMDHGAWPLLTIQLYIDQTGDLAFLLREQAYFKDHLIERAQGVDPEWDPSQGTRLRTSSGAVYRGTLLEHLLVQHLTAFFNVGDHNQIKLEGADWNDGMDMAPEKGESVAFTALYASNLRRLGQLLKELESIGQDRVELAEELLLLLDTLQNPVDYEDIEAKQSRLHEYFSAVAHTVSGKKALLDTAQVAADCVAKSDWLSEQIRAQEWISGPDGEGWFNGYYDNTGRQLEGDRPNSVDMTLTGQVFTLMGGVASDVQAEQIIRSVDRYLFDAAVGGYRLNTDFKEVLLNLGRCFGYAYGHKENGAMFSHMAVMYAYALYQRGYPGQAYRALQVIYQQSANFPVSRMYPGIPEYFDPQGRGLYPYLTGSASWYLLTLLTQSFGVRGELGDLVLAPNLVLEQFDQAGKTGVQTWFADRRLEVVYHNPDRLDVGDYRISHVNLDDQELEVVSDDGGCRIPRQRITSLDPNRSHSLNVWLEAR